MGSFKRGLLIFIAALFICAGFYGCAKKQLNTGGGELKIPAAASGQTGAGGKHVQNRGEGSASRP